MFAGHGLNGDAFAMTSRSERTLNTERLSSSFARTGTPEEVEGRRPLDPEKTLLRMGMLGTDV